MPYIRIFRLSNPLADTMTTATIISKLLEKHGDGFVNTKTPKEIIDDSARYYIAILFDLPNEKAIPIGCFAVNRVKNPAILKSVVVHKQWRGMGIGKKLIEIATRYALSQQPCVTAYVKRNNNIMLYILKKIGYKIVEEKDGCYKLIICRDEMANKIMEHINKVKIPI